MNIIENSVLRLKEEEKIGGLRILFSHKLQFYKLNSVA
jgi:hypothetical protein